MIAIINLANFVPPSQKLNNPSDPCTHVAMLGSGTVTATGGRRRLAAARRGSMAWWLLRQDPTNA